MGFNKKNKLAIWLIVLVITMISCTRVASNVASNNTSADNVQPQETDTPNFFLTEFIETANSPTETEITAPTVTETIVTAPASTEIPIDTATPEIVETPIPTETEVKLNVFIRSFDLIELDFDVPENLEGTVSRPGPQLSAIFLEEAPVIDGNILEWDGKAYALGYLVLGQEFYSGDEDIYGVAMLGWDQDNFYLGIQVVDNKFVQTAQGNDIYRGDSIELMFDGNLSGDYYNDYLDEDDYQIGISPGNLHSNMGSGEAFLWSPLEIFGTVENIIIASGFTDVGYTMEIAIPWDVFGVVAFEDAKFGFLLDISDNDFVNQNSQQSVVSFAPDRKLNDPTGWYTLVLNMPDPVD